MANLQCKISMNSAYKTLLSNNIKAKRNICGFIMITLKTLFKTSRPDFLFCRGSFEKIRSYNYRELTENKDISFDEVCDRFAYIYVHGAIHSALMYHHFSNMLRFNQTILKKITTMKAIRLCFLGGGPALEAVSISKLFNDILIILSNGEREALDVYVTIVDICPGWKKEGEFIINVAQNSLCDRNNVKIHFNFVEADLTKNFSKDLRKIIKEAHIVTMFNFLSDVNKDLYLKQEIPHMIHLILKCVSFKACLFYLDSSDGGLFNKMDRLIDKHPSTVRIYASYAQTFYVQSMSPIDQLLGPAFHHLLSADRCTISCSAWLKVRKVLKVDGLSCNSVLASVAVVPDREKLQWKKREPKIKKVLKSPVKFREICVGPSDKEIDADKEAEKSD